MVHLDVRNESQRKRLYRRNDLLALAETVCREEGVVGAKKRGPSSAIEISLLFCDDPFIAGLNRRYRKKRGPTDVLAFGQSEELVHGLRIVGDIVISLETVERFCKGDRAAMRAEIRLLFCHGLLHLLGYDHHAAGERLQMQAKQAHYLGIREESAWHSRKNAAKPASGRTARGRS